jgi:hypothetical protein
LPTSTLGLLQKEQWDTEEEKPGPLSIILKTIEEARKAVKAYILDEGERQLRSVKYKALTL